MNIFVLHHDIRRCAQFHCDRHVTKMILESVQMLLALLQTPAWQARVAAIKGYLPDQSGRVLAMRRVLPWWTFKTDKPST